MQWNADLMCKEVLPWGACTPQIAKVQLQMVLQMDLHRISLLLTVEWLYIGR